MGVMDGLYEECLFVGRYVGDTSESSGCAVADVVADLEVFIHF